MLSAGVEGEVGDLGVGEQPDLASIPVKLMSADLAGNHQDDLDSLKESGIAGLVDVSNLERDPLLVIRVSSAVDGHYQSVADQWRWPRR